MSLLTVIVCEQPKFIIQVGTVTILINNSVIFVMSVTKIIFIIILDKIAKFPFLTVER